MRPHRGSGVDAEKAGMIGKALALPFESGFRLQKSLLDLHISPKEICISSREIPISGFHLHKSRRKIPISSDDLCNFFFPITQLKDKKEPEA